MLRIPALFRKADIRQRDWHVDHRSETDTHKV